MATLTKNERGILVVEGCCCPTMPADQMEQKMQKMMVDMDDAKLLSMRNKMVEARMSLKERQAALRQDAYSSAEGSQLMSDVWYYDRLISKLECEMQCRMMSLEPEKAAAHESDRDETTLAEGALTTKGRERLDPADFAIPPDMYPIHDLAHARNAMARVMQVGTPEEQKKVRAAVYKRYPALKDRVKGKDGE